MDKLTELPTFNSIIFPLEKKMERAITVNLTELCQSSSVGSNLIRTLAAFVLSICHWPTCLLNCVYIYRLQILKIIHAILYLGLAGNPEEQQLLLQLGICLFQNLSFPIELFFWVHSFCFAFNPLFHFPLFRLFLCRICNSRSDMRSVNALWLLELT